MVHHDDIPEDAVGAATEAAADEVGDGDGLQGAAVTARLFAGLERHTRDGCAEQRVALARAPTVAALCEAVGLARGVAGLVLVNGVHGEETTTLHDGDEVSLFPPVGGG